MIKVQLARSGFFRRANAVKLAMFLAMASSAVAQVPSPAPAGAAPGATAVNTQGTLVPSTTAAATAERVIVTGSNIPTAEEVGPNPVDTYRRDDITRLGVRTPTDFIQRLPTVGGANT